MVKKILLGIVGLLVVLVIIGFVLPGKVEITKSITINAPASYAFEEVNNLENNPKWSYWNNLYKDNMKVTYGDIRTGVGALSSWEGEESGNGSMTITESVPDKSVKMDLNFMDQGTAQSWYTFEPEGEGTKVTTGFLVDFGMNPFMRLMGSTMMKSEMNKAFEYNLQHLKEVAEAKPKFTVQLSEEETAPVSYIGISNTASIEDEEALNAQMKKSYDELYGALAKAKVEIKGAPFAIYTKWDEATKQTEFVCAVPVDANAKVPAKYKIMQTSAGRAVKGMNYGSFDKLKDTHNQIAQYIAFKKLEIVGAPWEVYVTQPDVEKDTSKWVTEVYYPVK
jgi:effector-binding domain-containing protein/carbon monoxide dehydrogenase subunit G